ncbi:MAG TPA: arsenate reductase (glutaredoxin) [Caulobacteraceae bacterium]|jgi:arsenate reductase
MTKFDVTIFHNPNCGTSRNTLGLIRAAGYEPEVVDYVKAGWTSAQLKALFKRMGVKARDVLRTKGPAEELGLLKDGVSDAAIVQAMVENPILVERPIVSSPKGAVLARPFEKALEVLETKPKSFKKENGDVVKF